MRPTVIALEAHKIVHVYRKSIHSPAETRSLSAENPTGAKGQGGRHVDPNHGCSRDLGTGWKVRPCVGTQALSREHYQLVLYTPRRQHRC